MRKLIPLFILILAVLACSQRSETLTNSSLTDDKTNLEKIKPLFNVSDLVGKNPKQADNILGEPTEAWTMRSDSSRQLREYNYGDSLTLQFYKNRIERLVMFYGKPQTNPEIGFRLCGLQLNGLKPDQNPKIGDAESKIYNNFLIKNKPVKVVFNENFISIDF